jgi:hypothetical protein
MITTRTLSAINVLAIAIAIAMAPTQAEASWSVWTKLPMIAAGKALRTAVATNADGRPTVFAIGSDGALYLASQQTPNPATPDVENDSWSTWARSAAPSGVTLNDMSAGVNKDGRLEAFAIGSDLHVWHLWQDTPAGLWTGLSQLPNPPTRDWSVAAVSVGSNADGSLDVFVNNGFNGQLFHTSQATPNGGWTGIWQNLTGPNASQIGHFANSLSQIQGHDEVFARGQNNQAWFLEQTAPQGNWGAWQPIPGTAGEAFVEPVAALPNQDGRIELFFHSLTNFWHTWQGGNGGWSGVWDNLQQPSGTVDAFAASRLSDGRIALFAAVVNSGLWERSQANVNGGWGAWQLVNPDWSVVNNIQQLIITSTSGGRAEAIALGQDGQISHTAEVTPPPILAPPAGTIASPASILELTSATGSDPYANPQGVPSSPGIDAGKVACSNSQKWFQINTYNPAYEWEPMLPGGQIEQAEAGVAGWAMNIHGSGGDVWFTHPFGVDFNYDVVPDMAYAGLIAGRHSDDGDRDRAVTIAQTYYGLSTTDALHVEIDGDFLPSTYVIKDGDRVALAGRWIADCGHDDFHTEIHPPLVAMAARPADANTTHALIYSRPFLVDQEFGDGAMYEHFTLEIAKAALAVLPGVYQMQAHPRIFPLPFSGIQTFEFVLRAPTSRQSPQDQLQVSYSLSVRPGVTVTFHPASNDGIRMEVVMNAANYSAPLLPPKQTVVISKDELEAANPETVDLYNILQPLGGLVAAADLQRGIATDRYQTVVPVDPPLTVLTADKLYSAQIPTSTTLPWPILGHIDVGWARSFVAVATNKVVLPLAPTATISVPANVRWADTHIALRRGQHVVIDASGTWSNSGPPQLGPNGFANYRYPGTLLRSANLGSLIGMIGRVLFPVGTHFDGSVAGTGELFLSINDTASFADNQGALKVQIWTDAAD